MYLATARTFSTLAVFALVVLSLFGTYRPVQAATTLTVEIEADEYYADDRMGGNGCSLREALQAAYVNHAFGGCEANSSTDTIYLPAGEYMLYLTGAGLPDNQGGDLDILEGITITGEMVAVGEKPTTKINAAGLGDRVFHVQAGVVTLRNLEITGGQAAELSGSGILNQAATLQLEQVVVTANGNQTMSGGGISNQPGAMLTIIDSTISANGAKNGGGILNARNALLTITGSTIANNTASFLQGGGYGGGISNSGMLTISDSTISGNQAQLTGGGLLNLPYDPDLDYARISNTTISGNQVSNSSNGAGISSSGRLTISESVLENNAGIGLQIGVLSEVTITSSQFRGNSTADPELGAGIDCSDKLIIKNSQISSNTGTGLVVKNGAAVTIEKTIIETNTGVGINVLPITSLTITGSSVRENTPASQSLGAGIASAGILTVTNSTIANNAGTGLMVRNGSAALTNTTIGANNAPNAPDSTNSVGIASAGSLSLRSITIADQLGGGLRVDDGAAEAGGTLFAGNALANCTSAGTGTFTSQGYNLLDPAGEPGTCVFAATGDLVDSSGLDIQLNDNGGATFTYALPEGSKAVDAIARTEPACLAYDQRGFGRPVDGNGDGEKACDIGAYELGATGYVVYLPVVRGK